MKYRLLAAHVLPDGGWLPEGTEVGDDTGYPWKTADGEYRAPSTQMEGLDGEAKEKVDELHRRLYGTGPYWDQGTAKEVEEARNKDAEKQRELDEQSEAVSPMQEAERKYQEQFKDPEGNPLAKRQLDAATTILPKGAPFTPPPHVVTHAQPGPAAPQSSTQTASPTRGGTRVPSQGPATPKPPEGDEARPTNPNRDQYPKDG